jgi:hypothetical protein
MDKLARFSDYDVFAYVASGLGALVVWDIVSSTQYVLGAKWTVAGAAITLASAYIIGQILAAPSGRLLERQLVHHVLFRPSVILMESRQLGWRRLLKKTMLQDYYSPLDARLRRKVRERAAKEHGTEVSGDALFWCAFPVAKKDENAYARMEAFLKLYGFCRNTAFVGLVGACFIAIDAATEWAQSGWSVHVGQQFRWALLSLLIGVGMLHRYLKFFRLYTVEVFVAYSEAPPSGSNPT